MNKLSFLLPIHTVQNTDKIKQRIVMQPELIVIQSTSSLAN
ncbi:hypothetical protein FHS16_004791 [Paenibacillus endophyticus]|uniref:Uncharacterized protein n=1 Tax=Paenibacillus endophyticus TaxID=1294268 RepID=A0A7W5CCQ0_9BACL|nr:hypothetical protein [Paenibacillus endophyticus]MBB3154709.1 hypothetical protein [Paenibacillus endophyticus]